MNAHADETSWPERNQPLFQRLNQCICADDFHINENISFPGSATLA